METPVWSYISKAEHLLRWEVGRKKVWWPRSWKLVHLWNQVVTSWMTLSSSPPRVSEILRCEYLEKCVSFLFLHPRHRRVPGCSRCSANVCPTVEAGGGPRAYPSVCSEECWPQEGGLKERFFQSAEFINAACYSPFWRILHVTLDILEALRSLAVKKALVLLNPEFPKRI